jgi:hypothetical protein
MRRQHHDALLPLAELPAFRLELSTDVASIPPQLAEMSRAVS